MSHTKASILSNRELQVLQLISHGSTINKIADQLFISHHTVISYRKNLLIKLRVKNTASMVRRGFELGLLQIP